VIPIRYVAPFLSLALISSASFAQTPHTVTLNWTWSEGDGPVATGFNVKRGTATGGPYATIASLTGDRIRTYTDTSGPGNTLTPGATYCYVVTAVSGAAESPPSPEAQATVPANVTGMPTSIFISGLANAASLTPAFAPGTLVTVSGTQFSSSVAKAGHVPLPIFMAGVRAFVNGVAAPLYYVSPEQLNLQIPYETSTNGGATLQVENNGQATSAVFDVASAAPGIFTDGSGAVVPGGSAPRGQIATLFVNGAGVLTPAVPTGTAPSADTPLAELPQPAAATTVTVGGIPAPVAFIGVTAGLVGVTQINFQVPGAVGTGPQPVVVTVGDVSSPPAILNVTQ
jgi:adhesin/invasin